MSFVIKHQVYKSIVPFIVIICLMTAFLRIADTNVLFSLLVMYGCKSVSRLTLKIGFLVFVILVQYFNADLILYYIKNTDYFYIRYGSKNKTLRILLLRIFISDVIVILISLLSASLSILINGKISLESIYFSDIIITAFRGLGNCFFFSIIQIALLLSFEETKCFVIVTIGALGLTFFNPFDLSLKSTLVIVELLLWIGFYLVICSLMILELKKIFMREQKNYANRSL